MSEIVISCEKISRLSNIFRFPPDDEKPWHRVMRLEGDYIIVTNRAYLCVERHNASPVPSPVHITLDEQFVEQCQKESLYSSKAHFVINTTLGLVSARTTMGYQYPGNLLYTVPGENFLDRWREVIPKERAKEANNGLQLSLAGIDMLASTSPSKHLIFEKYMDVRQPSIVRDANDPDWFAVFWGRDKSRQHVAADLPWWFK